MQIIIHAVENNDRHNNMATLNGLRVELIDAPAITGSEKQIAWATDIREESIRLLAKKALGTLVKGINETDYRADELDAAIARINNEMMPIMADRLESLTAARIWIDNRKYDASEIYHFAK